jgi:hypothetical protein
MKLYQGQLWKQGKEYIRIVRLERLEVEYKSLSSPGSREGIKHVTSKKDFCRLLKQAHLLGPPKTADPPSAPLKLDHVSAQPSQPESLSHSENFQPPFSI